MPVVATTIKKGGDIHDVQPILDGLYVRIQTIEMNGKRRTVEQWSTNEVFFDAERFLQSCRSTNTSTPKSHDGLYVTYVFSQRWSEVVEDRAGWSDGC